MKSEFFFLGEKLSKIISTEEHNFIHPKKRESERKYICHKMICI